MNKKILCLLLIVAVFAFVAHAAGSTRSTDSRTSSPAPHVSPSNDAPSYAPNTSSQAPERNERKTKSLPIVDALISKLERDRWGSENEDCLQATLDMLEGVKNNTLWATWIWDSMQLPAGSLYGAHTHRGNYDQCLQAPWSADERHPGLRSQYCTVEVRNPYVEQTKTFGPFDDTEEYYRTPTKDGRSFNQYYFGACLPSICSSSSVAKISKHLLDLTHLPHGDMSVDSRYCETADEVLKYPSGFYAFWIAVGILIATTIISTLSNNDGTKQTALVTFTKSFCLKRNYHSLFTVSREEVKAMHGMRFITAVLIVLLHEHSYSFGPVVNGLDVNKFITSPLGLTLVHLEIVVDTFFAMSGLLLVRGLMMGKQKNVFYTLLKRYLRLIGPYALCIVYYVTSGKYMTRGPMWRKWATGETDICVKYWWKSLLLANTDIATLCHVVTWYISCDYQLAILGTFLFYLFRRNRKLGLAAFVTVAVALTVNLGLTVYRKQFDIIPFNFRVAKFMRQLTELNYTYLSSPARAGPYLVGMVMGYIITTYKPAEYRNVIDKKWSACIATVSLLVASTMLAIGAIFAGRPYDPLESAVVVATNRAIWGAMICTLIGVCEYGSLSLIPNFLSWPGFVPLSKLSYCIYLVHPIIMDLQKRSARSAATYAALNVLLNGSGAVVVSCGFSFVLYLILEAPLINISHAVFTENRPKPLEQNGTRMDINHTGNSMDTDRHDKNGLKDKLS